MRSLTFIVSLAVLSAFLSFAPLVGTSQELPKYSITVEAGTGSQLVFSPARIVLPLVPIILNVSVFNNGTAGLHTFTINDQTGTPVIDVRVNETENATTEFIVASAREITYNGETVAVQLRGGGIYFYCIPHEDLDMIGAIVIGTEERVVPELGLFLRAYWIGLIGLGAMLVWTGITYFIIKGSSRHFKGHRDHIRRGLP